jgi:hypothetical protein
MFNIISLCSSQSAFIVAVSSGDVDKPIGRNRAGEEGSNPGHVGSAAPSTGREVIDEDSDHGLPGEIPSPHHNYFLIHPNAVTEEGNPIGKLGN